MTTNHLPLAYQQLLAAGLPRWIPALMRLLQQYEGIERALEPEERPLDYLAEKLTQVTAHVLDRPAVDRERQFIGAVANMPLFYYRAAGNGTSWHPNNETFRQFESRVDTVIIWQTWTPQLSEGEVKHWLYSHLPDCGNARHTA